MRTQHGICGLCFHSPGCGVIAHFDENEKITRLEPDPQAPMGKVLCPIADSVAEVVYSEKRLRQPMRRVGPRGGYDFEPITWDAAYALIQERLEPSRPSTAPRPWGFTPARVPTSAPSRTPSCSRGPRFIWPPVFSFPSARPTPLAWGRLLHLPGRFGPQGDHGRPAHRDVLRCG